MITPYTESNESKKTQVERMFNSIAQRYDFLNHFLSFGFDWFWRKKAISGVKINNPKFILDIATGTADMAIIAAKRIRDSEITGTDISENMLKIGKIKTEKAGLIDRIKLLKADSVELPFAANTFDAAMVAFGVRNFEEIEKSLLEIRRVIKPGGIFVVLEFSKPRFFPFSTLYNFYFKKVLPTIAGIFAHDKTAYKYLPASVMSFPEREKFVKILENAGFYDCRYKPLTFGIVTIYSAYK